MGTNLEVTVLRGGQCEVDNDSVGRLVDSYSRLFERYERLAKDTAKLRETVTQILDKSYCYTKGGAIPGRREAGDSSVAWSEFNLSVKKIRSESADKAEVEWLQAERNTFNEWSKAVDASIKAKTSANLHPTVDVSVCQMPTLSEERHHVSVETDHTTKGITSGLGCPFASAINGSRPSSSHTPNLRSSLSSSSQRLRQKPRSKRASFNDPIRAEICAAKSQHSASQTEARVPVCPIRFLDQHPPEELAEFLQRHKKDLPRSHEVCLKRYQDDSERGRIDAKYGDMASMVQSLGEKHQSMLPEQPEDVDLDDDHQDNSPEKIEKWASAVQEAAAAAPPVFEEDAVDDARQTPNEDVADRTSRFDRPMRNVRVGESPTRPWGVPIPAKYLDTTTNGWQRPMSSGTTAAPTGPAAGKATDGRHNSDLPPLPDPTPPPVTTAGQKKSGVCPMHAGAASKEHSRPAVPTILPAQKDDPLQGQETGTRPVMVFNGPVFMGYPAEEAQRMMRAMNINGSGV